MRIAVTTGHEEVLECTSSVFRSFFAVLGFEGCTVHTLGPDETDLSGFDAILVGGPRKPLSTELIRALQNAVLDGAGLWIMSHGGGDQMPMGSARNSTNLSALIPGLAFSDDLLYFPTRFESYENLDCTLNVAETWLGTQLELRYVMGGSFSRHPGLFDGPVTTLDASVDPGLRAARALKSQEGDYILTSDDASDSKRSPQGEIYATFLYGAGRVVVLGSTLALSDTCLTLNFSNLRLFQHGLGFVLGLSATTELERRLQRPQRHRLLHGYPMAPLMDAENMDARLDAKKSVVREGIGEHRATLLGILPHPFCNPQVRGCGFCTFPQEKLRRDRIPDLVGGVIKEMDALKEQNALQISAVYFGGGTANLTPPSEFEKLLRAIARNCTLDDGAEITLEGVPKYFQIENYRLMRDLRGHFPKARTRISMGVQTLDPGWLRRMGRQGFGGVHTLGEVVEEAHALNIAVSCDLLINLPGQPLEMMLADIDGVVALGFDQICLYHLVLFDGLGTPWSEDSALLGALANNAQAFEHWHGCVQRLRSHGFEMTTLTNFSRRPSSVPDFQYELRAFTPDEYDLLGVGPGAISLWSGASFWHGNKWLNARKADDYLRQVHSGARDAARWFVSEPHDQAILFLTRSVARLSIDLERYEALFQEPARHRFGEELEAIEASGLVRSDGNLLVLTERGMFFADSVAGLFAWRRVPQVRARHLLQTGRNQLENLFWQHLKHTPFRYMDPNDSMYGTMG